MPDRIIRHRPQRRLGRQRAFATCAMVFVAAASALGCELVIGDAPPKKSTGPALAEAGTTPPEVSSSGGGGASAGGASSGTGGSGNAGVGGRDLRDAGLPPPDAKVPDAAPPSCTTAVTWYQDDDRDGYG